MLYSSMGLHPVTIKEVKRVRLKRDLSFIEVTLAGVGIILGAGIYALIGIASSHAGNLIWLSFLVSGIIAILTGLSYAELSTLFHNNSGEYDYIKASLSKRLAFLMGLSVILAGVISGA